jgi:site-specific DNA-methyltransferase (adenine-specific)
MDISKQFDKRAGVEREVVGIKQNTYDGSVRNTDNHKSPIENASYDGWGLNNSPHNTPQTAPTSDLAKEWSGWGTALKPAHEPVVMARKPLIGTVVDNVLEWGTGGINIDESRIPTDAELGRDFTKGKSDIFGGGDGIPGSITSGNPNGRFPANIIFDEEAGKLLDEQSGTSKSTGGRIEKKIGWGEFGGNGSKEIIDGQPGFGDVGGASRFFYCPKTNKSDRNEGLDEFDEKRKSHITSQNFENALTGAGNPRNPYSKNNHPTVKPTDLMLYLIRLVTPKGGTTLDPFMGSGSTGKAAIRGGFDFVGIEREKEYMKIAEARIQYEKDNPYIEDKQTRITVNKSTEKFW